MRIGITGASGLLGTALVPALRGAGHAVVRIGRGADADVRWNPAVGELDAADCEGIDAFVHLAGAHVGQRWTALHRRAIGRTTNGIPTHCNSDDGPEGLRGDRVRPKHGNQPRNRREQRQPKH